jgi:hypothetical protein
MTALGIWLRHVICQPYGRSPCRIALVACTEMRLTRVCLFLGRDKYASAGSCMRLSKPLWEVERFEVRNDSVGKLDLDMSWGQHAPLRGLVCLACRQAAASRCTTAQVDSLRQGAVQVERERLGLAFACLVGQGRASVNFR